MGRTGSGERYRADMKHTLFVNGKIVLSNGILEQGKLMAAWDRILDILTEERGRRGTGE